MVDAQAHRGPDARGEWVAPGAEIGLGHNRLSIIDLSVLGTQPMLSHDGRLAIVLNGEIYNYLELRTELLGYPFRTQTDTEVVLAAYEQWGDRCLDRFLGMFAFAIWDSREGRLFAARDRFGVKPLFLHVAPAGGVTLASEIKALHAAGVPRRPDPVAWSRYFGRGMYDVGRRTFWSGIERLPAGWCLEWQPAEGLRSWPWYDPADAALASGPDERSDDEVADELLALLEDSVRLRFRADVEVGVCLSGGLDSSLLLALIGRVCGDRAVHAFTFACGDPVYDETPFVRLALAGRPHPWHLSDLRANMVPELARRVQHHQDEPFGGVPTLGMALVHACARDHGVTVLLDGNGLDEAWAGYEYYGRAQSIDPSRGPVQSFAETAGGPSWLLPEFAALAPATPMATPFADPLRDLQYRDLKYAKIPRAMRFADRVSMMCSREVREPFLDHRIVELGLRQPASRKLRDGQGKWLLRRLASALLPSGLYEAPKRPVQTPQREWLRGPLAAWAESCIEDALADWGREWLEPLQVRAAWRDYVENGSDSSFHVWQWLNLGLVVRETS